ncbi:hypothetical protein Acor_28670 [Acrocarpospora corrugata]|uniref:CU044_5270 family protein n=1 Tax=Acrocarpospora corrugata TaxID=35763 RepID=A0A5M3W0J5_9ACTN|nr:CU044_5270 family protein [Acrocarpospora corrugata]GES00803.1 hypothetical protein Acor_28670 [Acrocarpospora corrugata]
MNEMDTLSGFRAEVPRPEPADLRAQEDRLLAALRTPPPRPALRGWTRGWKLGLVAGLAVAAAATAVVALPSDPPRVIHAMPVAHSAVLTRAAQATAGQTELRPRPGQYLVYESRMMFASEGTSRDGVASRYLTDELRRVWLPVEGDATGGFIDGERLPPKVWPGWPIPPEAWENLGRYRPEKLADFDQRAEQDLTDYAHTSAWPTDPEGMYRRLYTGLGNDEEAHELVWGNVQSLLRESYLPAAQRAALFRAAAAIPGVVTVPDARDAAGRPGIAAARLWAVRGTRVELIFDPKTYQYLANVRSSWTRPRPGPPWARC